MKAKLKRQMEDLVLELNKKGDLGARQFFIAARNCEWGKTITSDQMVDGYNETLGRLFGKGLLSGEQVKRAMKVQ